MDSTLVKFIDTAVQSLKEDYRKRILMVYDTSYLGVLVTEYRRLRDEENHNHTQATNRLIEECGTNSGNTGMVRAFLRYCKDNPQN